MLKVLMVYYEPRMSGQTANVLSLVRGLDAHKYNITVVLPSGLQAAIEVFIKVGVNVIPIALRKVLWSPQAVGTLARLIRKHNFDIVHIHSQEAGLLARIIVRLAGSRAVVYTPQTIDVRQVRWKGLYRLIERSLSHITDVIISVNELDRKRLIEWGISAHKVVTIPNGVDLDLFKGPVDVTGLRRKLGLDVDRPLVMQVGRLSAQKNPLAFVDGAACVAREHPNAQFALIGEGPLRDAVAAHIQALGMDRQLHLLGWWDEGFKLIAAADIVSLTSQWEGAPYTLLEAMAWSRPVVATAVNGCPEIVDQGITGFIVPPGDTAAWAGCVTKLLDDPALAVSMGQSGKTRLEERFTLQAMIINIQHLYNRSIIPLLQQS